MDDYFDFEGNDYLDDPYDYSGNADISPNFQHTFADTQRTSLFDPDLKYTGDFEVLETRAAQSMARTASEKALVQIRRQISFPSYRRILDSKHYTDNDIIVGLQDIERLEFYNPDALVAAAIFKISDSPIDKTSISDFQRPDTVNNFNLYRYYRFLEKIDFKPRER